MLANALEGNDTDLASGSASLRVDTCGLRTRARGAVLFERKLSRDIAAPTELPVLCERWLCSLAKRTHTCVYIHTRTHARESHALERIILASLHLGCSISFRSSYICCSLLRQLYANEWNRAAAKVVEINNRNILRRK